MIRSLLRMLKHITLAILAIIAAVCIAEVGLRGHRLYQQCEGAGSCELSPQPCPLAFHQLPPLQNITTSTTSAGESIAIRLNRFGLRGGEVSTPKPPEAVRIVCLGDDATFAADIPEERTFAALVQQQLSRQSGSPVEVVNAGIPGYCPLLTLAWARQRLVSLQPDLVILCCDRSDVADDRRVRPLARYTADGMLESICHPAAVRRSENLVQAIEQEFHLAALLRRQLSDYIGGSGSSSSLPDDWESSAASSASDAIQIRQTWEPIAALRDLCHHLSADFVVAIVPSSGAATESGADDWTVQLLAEAAEAAGVPYLDVTADFSTSASASLFTERSGFLSVAGHEVFAELLSWAVLYRSNSPAAGSHPDPAVTPASASSSASAVPEDVAEKTSNSPTPLPTIRRPRTDDTPDWVQ